MNEHDNEYKHLERERIISLADLIEEIWRKIWLIIILAVVFAVCLAGYKYVSDRQKAAAAAKTASQTEGATSLTEEEMSEVDSMVALYDAVAAQDQYMTDSVRMNIDPYHEDRVTMQYMLQTEPDNLSNALQALGTYVAEGAIGPDLAELNPDMDSTYLGELVTFSQGTQAVSLSSLGEVEVTDQNGVFSVVVIGTDEDAAEQLANDVQQCLASYAAKLQGDFGSCRLKLIDQAYTQVYDSNLKTEQTSALTDQITLQNRIATQTESLTDDQVYVLNTILASGTEEAAAAQSSSAAQESAAIKVHISKRNVLIGIVIGIVIGIIVIVLYYIGRGTLNVSQEIPGEFGITVFGQVHEKKQRNPLVRAWRRAVYKKKPLPPETERQIVLMNLKKYCRDHELNHILLAGSQVGLSENESLRGITEALKNESIEAEIAGGMPDLPESLEMLDRYSCVALVETLHRSYYKNIVREVELCEAQNITLAGAIVLD